jgi:hypothetical protein
MKAALSARKQEKEVLSEKWERECLHRDAHYEEKTKASQVRWIAERETLNLQVKEKEAEIQQILHDKETEHAAGIRLSDFMHPASLLLSPFLYFCILKKIIYLMIVGIFSFIFV